MPPNNLRSITSQVTRGEISVLSRRDFPSCRCSCRYESKGAGRRTVSAGGLTMRQKVEYFGAYIMHGYSAFLCWEIIELPEYRRRVQKSLDERRGMATKMNLLVMLRWMFLE